MKNPLMRIKVTANQFKLNLFKEDNDLVHLEGFLNDKGAQKPFLQKVTFEEGMVNLRHFCRWITSKSTLLS